MTRINVFIDSPHRLLREGLTHLVAARFTVSEEGTAEIVVRDLCSCLPPYPPPPKVPTLALICGSDDEAIELLRSGYRGVLRSDEGVELLERALQALIQGQHWAARHIVTTALDKRLLSSLAALTQREREIHGLVTQGYTNTMIAQHLGLSVNTVKAHLSNILHKLAVKNRTALILGAQRFH